MKSHRTRLLPNGSGLNTSRARWVLFSILAVALRLATFRNQCLRLQVRIVSVTSGGELPGVPATCVGTEDVLIILQHCYFPVSPDTDTLCVLARKGGTERNGTSQFLIFCLFM